MPKTLEQTFLSELLRTVVPQYYTVEASAEEAEKERGFTSTLLRLAPILTMFPKKGGSDDDAFIAATKIGAELLFDIVSTAYERTSLIVTTNLPFENWTEVLGSERLTGATLDRLTHRCHILETRGESYRLREAKRRRGKKSDQAQTEPEKARRGGRG